MSRGLGDVYKRQGYIRVEAISQEVNNENCYVLWTNNSYPQNKKIGCDLVWIKENFLWN